MAQSRNGPKARRPLQKPDQARSQPAAGRAASVAKAQEVGAKGQALTRYPPWPTLIQLGGASRFRPFEALALFDARPGWDLLKTALNSDPQPRDGRETAGAFVRVPLRGDDRDRYREVVQFTKRI